ncbi:hypothetical protein NEDG_01175 [Nematocida displodere]|uniref:Uncharacterized protein n=1 Tax=Nematocida displodere TaxID=1805483 RepID=A0A177EBD2_9MICR|nr:hypothetical protein NEDG_01175 [Nematocida displodere]
MLLYEDSIDIAVPEGYKNISHMMAAQNYQYMFAGDDETDNFMIIDLMQPIQEVDLHIEDILSMNDIVDPQIVSLKYTCASFKEGIGAFLAKYKSTIHPELVEKTAEGLNWMCAELEARVSRNDGVVRSIQITIGVTKYTLSDIVTSVFRETKNEKQEEAVRKMVQTIQVLNTDIFIQ